MDTEQLQVKVTVLSRQFTLKANAANEASIRQAAERLDSMISTFQKSFGSRDIVDPVIMAALSIGAELEKLKANMAYKDTQLESKMEELNTILDDYLHPNQNSL